MSELAEATGTAGRMTITLRDESGTPCEFTVGRLRMKAAGLMESWLEQQDAPGAVIRAREVVSANGLPDEVARQIIEGALAEDRAWPPKATLDPVALMVGMASRDGGTEQMMLRILQQASPNVPESKLAEFVQDMDLEMVERVRATAFNLRPEVQVSRASTEVVILDPQGIDALVRGLADLLRPDAPKDDVEVAAMAAKTLLPRFGTVLRIGLVNGSPAVPKGEVTATQEARPRKSSRST